jgi:hypothetical protein
VSLLKKPSRKYGVVLVARRAMSSTDEERVSACSEFRAAEESMDTRIGI